MCPIIEDSHNWKLIHAAIEMLREIYHSDSAHPEQANEIKNLIRLLNAHSTYIYKNAPDYKFSFLSYYLCKAVLKEQSDLIGFLNFLFFNGAYLNGVEEIKDYLIRGILNSQMYFDLFRYLFEVHQFKLEENLTLSNYDEEREQRLLNTLAFEKKLMEIDLAYTERTFYTNDEVQFAPANTPDFREHMYKPNSLSYIASRSTFVYFDFGGRLRYCLPQTPPDTRLIYTVNMGTLTKQEEVIACPTHIEILSKVLLKLPELPQDEHPIHLIKKHPNSEFTIYLLQHCTDITYAKDNPLMVATRSQAYDLMNELIAKNDIDINYRNSRNEDAVTIAIQQNDMKALNILFKGKPQILTINNPSQKYTAFHIAALYHRVELLNCLAYYAKSTQEQFGTLFSNESKTILHWIMKKRILRTDEFLSFLIHCDATDPEEEHAKHMERIIYNLFSAAYSFKDRVLPIQLISYLITTRAPDNHTLITQIMKRTLTQPIILYPESEDERIRLPSSTFCDQSELQFFIDILIKRISETVSNPELSKLALFACKQNHPLIAQQLITHHQASLAKVVAEEECLLRELLTSKAYASAEWLIMEHANQPNLGFRDLITFLLESVTEQCHFGFMLLHEEQPQFLLALLSQGYLDFLLHLTNSDGKTLLDMTLIARQHALSLAVVNRILSKGGSILNYCTNAEERLLLLKLFKTYLPGEFNQLAYHICKPNMNLLIQAITDKENTIDPNRVDDQGRNLLHFLLDDCLSGHLAISDLIECIKQMKLRLTHLDNNQSGLLIWACEHEHLPLVKACIQNKHWKQHNVLEYRPGDQESALDIAYAKRDRGLFMLLWNEITEHTKKQHIKSLMDTAQRNLQAQERLIYLSTLNLAKYTPPKTSSTAPVMKVDPITKSYNELIRSIKSDEGAKKILKKLESETEELNTIYSQYGIELLEEALKANKMKIVKRLLMVPVIQQKTRDHIDLLLTKMQQQDHALDKLFDLLQHCPQLKEALHTHPQARTFLAPYNNGGHPDIIPFYNQLPITSEQLTIACTNKDMPALQSLLMADECARLNENIVYLDAIAQKDFDLLEELLCDFCATHYLPKPDELLRPMSYIKNEHWRSLIKDLGAVFHTEDDSSSSDTLEANLCGSSIYTETPNDLDIRIQMNIYDTKEQLKLDMLLAKLKEDSEPFEKNKDDEFWGYPTRFGRIIAIKWKGISLELVISQLSPEENARHHADFTFSGMYFNLNTFSMKFVEGINACADLKQKTICTIKPSFPTFTQDPKRIFRAIRLHLKTGFTFSEDCIQAIHHIANSPTNLFSTMNYDALCHQINLILSSDSPKTQINVLIELKLLVKIREAFLNNHKTQRREAVETKVNFLMLIQPNFEQQDQSEKQQKMGYIQRRQGLHFYQMPPEGPKKTGHHKPKAEQPSVLK